MVWLNWKLKKSELEEVLDLEKAKLPEEVLKDKNQDLVLQLKVLKVVKCLCIEDYPKEVLVQSIKIKSSEKIDIKYLHSSKILKKKYEKIKILGQGEIKDKLNLEVHYLSNSAKEKLSKNGSTIKILESK